MVRLIQNVLRKKGYQLQRYHNTGYSRRMRIISFLNINVVLDVGANTGQYATKMRDLGYKHKIVSFEPLKKTFASLETTSAKDNNWQVNNYALGNEETSAFINVSNNSQASSFLNILPEFTQFAPELNYIGTEEIAIKRLDSIYDSFCTANDNVLLKIDTQGFEKNVIEGAENALHNVRAVQLEMSIVPLYENEMTFIDMVHFMEDRGFCLFSLEDTGISNAKGKLLQIDGVFVNKKFDN